MFRRSVAVAVLACGVVTHAAEVDYDGGVLPEEVGFERVGTFDADRWIDDGWFFQYVDLGIWAPPPGGEQDLYQRSLAEFSESPFFVEWRVVTDAPRTEIDGVGGASLVMAGGGVLYHFTIAQDQVRLVRGVPYDNVWIDINPGVPHTYRLEVDRETNFKWFIDGELIISDVPEGDFPSFSAVVGWGAKYHLSPSTSAWDYVRYGTIPEPATGLLVLFGAAPLVMRRSRRR